LGKNQNLNARTQSRQDFQEKDSLLPDFLDRFFVKIQFSLRLCAFALGRQKPAPND
jgi:hypothetical protein